MHVIATAAAGCFFYASAAAAAAVSVLLLAFQGPWRRHRLSPVVASK
jgi:hypothetical protein